MVLEQAFEQKEAHIQTIQKGALQIEFSTLQQRTKDLEVTYPDQGKF